MVEGPDGSLVPKAAEDPGGVPADARRKTVRHQRSVRHARVQSSLGCT